MIISIRDIENGFGRGFPAIYSSALCALEHYLEKGCERRSRLASQNLESLVSMQDRADLMDLCELCGVKADFWRESDWDKP